MTKDDIIDYLKNNLSIKLSIKNQGIEASLFLEDNKIDSDRIEGFDLRTIITDRMHKPIPPRNINRHTRRR